MNRPWTRVYVCTSTGLAGYSGAATEDRGERGEEACWGCIGRGYSHQWYMISAVDQERGEINLEPEDHYLVIIFARGFYIEASSPAQLAACRTENLALYGPC